MSQRYRAYPTDAQAQHLLGHCDHARFVWNLCMQQQDFHDRYRRTSNYPAWPTSRDLADAREVDPWLKAGSSSVQQQALRDYTASMSRWFKACDTARKKGRKLPGRPDWRRKKKGQGFVVRDVRVEKLNRHWSQIQVPKFGDRKATWIRFSLSRPLPAEYTSARFTLDKAGRWHVSFTAEPKTLDRTPTGAIVGVDRGVKNTIALSDGTFDHAPALSDGEQDEFLRRQYEMSCAPLRSEEREMHREVVARTYARLADRRRDWVEQSTTQMVRDYDVIVVERLEILNMVRSAKGTVEKPGKHVKAKAKLNAAILAQCWGLWLQRLKTKAELAGVTVIEVPAHYTSQTCRACGHRAKENRPSQAEFCCVKCGDEGHADVVAAKNVLARGLGQGAWTGPEAQVAA